jgi:prepilin-type N-terminal cleavage/methylation domain-containing protein
MLFFKSGKGFTLLELIFVVITMGILTSIALPIYNKTLERSGWEEAIINLKLIRAAELVYRSEHNTFFIPSVQDFAGNQDEAQINNALHINLPTSLPLKWQYYFDPCGVPPPASTFTVKASRGGSIWMINESTTEPWCSAGGCLGG